jgi:hypothetical protein
MKRNSLRAGGAAVALAVIGLLCLVGVQAQQNKNNSGGLLLRTNWVGYLVFGREDSIDAIAHGAFPTTDRQVEIGLRSDGTVVWRKTSN